MPVRKLRSLPRPAFSIEGLRDIVGFGELDSPRQRMACRLGEPIAGGSTGIN